MTPAAVPPGNWRAVMEAGERLAKAVERHEECRLPHCCIPTAVRDAARHFQAVKKGEGTA